MSSLFPSLKLKWNYKSLKNEHVISFKKTDDTLLLSLKSSLSQFSQSLFSLTFTKFQTGPISSHTFLLLNFFLISTLSELLKNNCLYLHPLKCKDFLNKSFHNSILTKRMLRDFLQSAA